MGRLIFIVGVAILATGCLQERPATSPGVTQDEGTKQGYYDTLDDEGRVIVSNLYLAGELSGVTINSYEGQYKTESRHFKVDDGSTYIIAATYHSRGATLRIEYYSKGLVYRAVDCLDAECSETKEVYID